MQTRVWRLGAVALAASLAAVLAGHEVAAAPTAAPEADPVPQLLKSPPDVARGKALFMGTCGAYCHRPAQAADGPAPPASDAPYLFDCDWLHGGADQQVFHTITHGVPGTRMVAFGGAIPDQDIWRIVAYLKSASQCKK